MIQRSCPLCHSWIPADARYCATCGRAFPRRSEAGRYLLGAVAIAGIVWTWWAFSGSRDPLFAAPPAPAAAVPVETSRPASSPARRSGDFQGPGWVTCPRCQGAGRVILVVPHPSYGTESEVPVSCPRCKGIGRIYTLAGEPYYR